MYVSTTLKRPAGPVNPRDKKSGHDAGSSRKFYVVNMYSFLLYFWNYRSLFSLYRRSSYSNKIFYKYTRHKIMGKYLL